jgi:hypothetical protein
VSTVASVVIQKAYQNAGKIARGGTPSSAQNTDALSTLQDIVAYEGTKGLKLWLETEATITPVAGQQLYSFYPSGSVPQVRPYRVKEASYTDSGGSVRNLDPISRSEWTGQPNRSGQGAVTQYFVEKLYDRLNFYCWLTPDTVAATGTILVVLANQPTSPLLISSDTMFPAEWALFLQWRLAQELTTGMPQDIVGRCDQMTMMYREQLEAFDVEEAPTFFTVNTQGSVGSRFE